LTTFDFDRNISRREPRNENLLYPLFDVKIGELWSTNKKVISTHVDAPNWTFFEILYISPFRGCCLLKFLHDLQHPK